MRFPLARLVVALRADARGSCTPAAAAAPSPPPPPSCAAPYPHTHAASHPYQTPNQTKSPTSSESQHKPKQLDDDTEQASRAQLPADYDARAWRLLLRMAAAAAAFAAFAAAVAAALVALVGWRRLGWLVAGAELAFAVYFRHRWVARLSPARVGCSGAGSGGRAGLHITHRQAHPSTVPSRS